MTKKSILVLLVLSLLTLSLSAQKAEEENVNVDPDQAINGFIVSRVVSIASEKDTSGLFMVFASGQADKMFLPDFLPDIQKELDITGEQRKLLEAKLEEVPKDFGERMRVLDDLADRFLRGNYKMSEEDTASVDAVLSYVLEEMNKRAFEVYSPEQIQKLDGMILALTGGLESPLFNDRHMAALDMTEEQKEQFATIVEEMKGEREKMVAGVTASINTMLYKDGVTIKGLVTTLAQFKNYTKELKKRRSAVLTAAQISKMKTMMRLPKSHSVANLLPKWMPDADSWKPGDPLPEGLVPENKELRPFPRAEKE
jgi:hypothetical protein